MSRVMGDEDLDGRLLLFDLLAGSLALVKAGVAGLASVVAGLVLGGGEVAVREDFFKLSEFCKCCSRL